MPHKDDFFDENVLAFCDWMCRNFYQFSFGDSHHRWTSRRSGIGVPRGTEWSACSLYDAYDKYQWCATVNQYQEWSGCTFKETEKFLNALKRDLAKALQDQNGTEVQKICCTILEWGGVLNRPYVATQFKNPGGIPEENICDFLNDSVLVLNGHLSNGSLPETDMLIRNQWPLKVDSGTTKIFSLLCDGLVMYDRRVASALSYLVRLWWVEREGRGEAVEERDFWNGIPTQLRFSRATKHRNPNPVLANGSRAHIFRLMKNDLGRLQENIKVSWLLAEVLERQPKRAQIGNQESFLSIAKGARLRALESSLFMIGYDVNG